MYFLLNTETVDDRVIITGADRYAPFDDDPDGEYDDDVDYEKEFMKWAKDKVVYRYSGEKIPSEQAIEVNWVPGDDCVEGFIVSEELIETETGEEFDHIDDIMVMSESTTENYNRFFNLTEARHVEAEYGY